jgi:hypothetical protein
VTRTRLLPLAFLLPAFSFAGCSGDKIAPAKVSGNITYNGQPLKAGILQFHTKQGDTYIAYDGRISLDGTYSATDLPEGELIVTVTTEHLNPGRKGPTKSKEYDRRMSAQQQPEATAVPQEEPYTKIPDKYSKPNTSPLSVTLKGGRNLKDLELEP